MLTDDELTRELGGAFHSATEDITYTGRRQPPRSRAAVALPIAAGAVAIAAAALVATAGSPATGTQPAAGTEAAHDGGAVASPTLISDSISLAGLTLRYQRPAGLPDPLRIVHDVDRVPDGATPVPLVEGATAKAWVGVDPATGDNAAYLQSPARNGGETFAILSSSWTQDQLVDVLRNGWSD